MQFTKGLAIGLLLALVGFAAKADGGAAQDLSESLGRAEANAARYEAEASAQRQQVTAAATHYRAAAREAAPLALALRRSRADLRGVRRRVLARERKAKTHITKAEDRHQQEVDDHDEEVHNGIGFGLAALVAAGIAIVWGFFRASAAVAALTRLDLARAFGLCVGGGLLALILGGAFGQADGAVGIFGSFVFCLGLILPTALLLARHSAEVQRGRSQPLLRRERLPDWVPLAVAGLMLVFFLAGTGSALFAPAASSQSISAQLKEEAEGAGGEVGAEELEAAQEEVAMAKQRAAAPLVRRNRAQRQLASARRELQRMQSRLAAARSSEHSFSRQLVALERKEQREREEEEARLARVEQKRIEDAERKEEEELAACDYNPCLPPASDYDCEGGSGDGPLYTGPVEVTGIDIYDLDRDNDGIGCEPE